MNTPDSIGPYFFALHPSQQIGRIDALTQAIIDHNPKISAHTLAITLRGALASMTKRPTMPVSVEAHGNLLEIRVGDRFMVAFNLNKDRANHV